METLSEYAIIIKKPQQTIFLIPEDITLCVNTKETTKDKILSVVRIMGYILLALGGLTLLIIAIWGIIHWPWMIVFFFLGLLIGR